jgi:hypothetical protein
VLPCLLGAGDVFAADYSLTGFGTLGYAVSDQKAPYLRYIDKSGTFRADSLIGLQGEAQLDPQWGATVQIVASAPRYKEDGLAAQVRWAFASYRPNNEWLFRLGRLRPPVLINTQNAEVGVTYDQARLPVELYSLSPVYDIDGGAFARTWTDQSSETSLDGYWGKSRIKQRLPFQPDTIQPFISDKYLPESIQFMGVVLTYATGPATFRGGVHRATLHADQGRQFLEGPTPEAVPGPTPFGGLLYVPGAVSEKVVVKAVTFGADWRAGNWRMSGEYGRRMVAGTKMASTIDSAYVNVAYVSGKWTPYATYARILSAPSSRNYYKELVGTPVPLAVQGAPFFLAPGYHRSIADAIFLFDQHSVMLGASYNLTLASKLKLEWMRTRIGLTSALVDGDIHNKSFGVFSMSYNFAF